MSTTTLLLGGLIAVGVLLWLLWERLDSHKERKARREAEDVAALGEVIPTSLHPVIDPDRCMGSGACTVICPEHGPLQLVGNRATLVNPLGCVGHGACEAACPVQAIQLVYGTKKRGVELPRVDASYQTNQPGIYVVGELGGMGLIRNAVTQGRLAAEHVATSPTPRRGARGAFDAVVVGAGPAGIAATLGLMAAKLRVLLVEREALGGTITHYPRNKVVMTGDLELPLYGRVKKKTMSKEQLVALWQDIEQKCRLPLATGHVVKSVTKGPDDLWEVASETERWLAANVVLALGVRGSPRKLEVAGEELPKVAYRLLEPEPFAGRHVMVVGGGNAAVESAIALADFGGCASVSISYRRDAFARCRGDNRRKIDAAIASGKVAALLSTNITRIEPDRVRLRNGSGGEKVLPNDAIIVQVGGTAPADLLKSFGVELVTKYGER